MRKYFRITKTLDKRRTACNVEGKCKVMSVYNRVLNDCDVKAYVELVCSAIIPDLGTRGKLVVGFTITCQIVNAVNVYSWPRLLTIDIFVLSSEMTPHNDIILTKTKMWS
jgi:hypothetical protein